MPRTNAIIPVSKGIDQRLDERLRAPDSLAVLTNAFYRRGDAVQKRNGFTRLGADVYSFDGNAQTDHTLSSEGQPRGLFSTGTELCAHGYTSVYAYDPTSSSWYSRGHVSSFAGSQRDSFTSALSYDASDCASGANEIVHVAATNQYSQSTGSGFNGFDSSIVWRKETVDGIETLAEQTIVSSIGDADPKYVSPHIINNGNGYIVGFQSNGPVTWDLEFRPVVGNAVGAPFVTHNDVYNTGTDGQFYRYDMTPGLFAGQWAYAYIRDLGGMGGTEIYVAIYTNTGLIVSTTITPPGGFNWSCVSLTFCQSQNLLSVAAGLQGGAGTVELYGLDLTTLAVVYGPVSHALQYAPHAVAIAETNVEIDYVNGNVQECLTIVANSGTTSGFDRYALDTILALPSNGAALSTDVTFNTYAVSKPWKHNNRIYCAAKCRYGREPERNPPLAVNDIYAYQDGYCGEVVLDLLQPYEVGAFVAEAHLVGRYNFGVTRSASISSPSGEWDMIRGSLANVTQTVGGSSSVYRYATQRIINKVPGFNISQLAADVVELDFDGKLLASPATRGSATVGGGSVSWYSGRRVEELGFASAPVIARISAALSPQGYLTGPVFYVGVFESYDNKGNLIRSLPGPRAEFAIPFAGPNSVEVEFYTIGPTSRYMNGKRFEVALYRAQSDGVYYRVSKPLDNNVIVDTNVTSPQPNPAWDTGPNVSFDPVYTQSGAELEAAGPDGAAFVATTSQRVWLAGFFRRDRVQYSKPYNAATANEFAVAPEFNDAFAYLTPGGQQVTGLAEMDDKVVVFTKSNIYAIAGNGPDDGGRNNDFSGLQLINSDTGCIDARSIVSFPGGIMFQAASGIFVLGRDFQLTFLGAQVRDITDEYNEVTSACLVPAQNHVRFTVRKDGAASIILCYDLDQGAWLRWEPQKDVSGTATPLNIVGSCLHGGAYHVLDADGSVWFEDSTAYKDDGAIYVPMTVATSWLQAANQSGFQRVRTVAAMLKSNDAHNLTMSVYQDFASVPSQSYTWTAPVVALQKLNELVELRTQVQKCTAFKIAITDTAGSGTTTGQGYECAGFAVELSGKRGLYKPGPQQRN